MQSDAVQPGQVLADRYVLEREIGHGGMATVYLAQDRRHRRSVAVKVMRSDLSAAVGAERFLREIEIAARLQHPHILPLFDSGEHDGVLYYVMPFIDGESLEVRIAREGQLPVSDAITIAHDVASALAYAHERSVVHRDIKPGNILLSSGSAIVTDFGIARLFDGASEEPITRTGIAVGTPSYMSPEQASADRIIDGRADMYALGCTLYEMLAGVPPFTGPARSIAAQHIGVEPRAIRQLRPQVSLQAERAIMTALAKAPGDRFRSCAEFAAALTEREPLGSTDVRVSGAESAARQTTGPRVGPLVSRMCDRWRQVNAFDSHFRESQRQHPGMPRIYVVHGDEGQAHDSLVERLLATRISFFATEAGGQERGAVPSLRIPWPDTDSVEVRKRDLVVSVFREVAPTYMGSELSATAFSQLKALTLSPIVVLRHDIRAGAWDASTEGLLHWYVNDFWGSLTPGAQAPLVVVFLKVIYPAARSRIGLSDLLRTRRRRKAAIQKALERILLRPGTTCPALILNELSSITADDVKDWFNQNEIYDSERKRHDLAESIFKQAPVRQMAEVEVALENIRIIFARQQWLEEGPRT